MIKQYSIVINQTFVFKNLFSRLTTITVGYTTCTFIVYANGTVYMQNYCIHAKLLYSIHSDVLWIC